MCRLRSCTVLVVGLRGLGSEVVKNIVLAGVHAVTLLDHTSLSKNDFAERFLIRQDGENVRLKLIVNVRSLFVASTESLASGGSTANAQSERVGISRQ